MRINKNIPRDYQLWLSISGLAISILIFFGGHPVMFTILWWVQLILGVAALIGIVYFGQKALKNR
ncbi:hypothetical protein [Lentilactobacillus sunkii]|nr:hypothetical protein [Lentilactobacillus sunkii]